MYYGAKPELFRLAERMRRNPTVAEDLLWKYLKKYRLQGFVFRRQHPLDLFIVDFYCHKIKLVIEVDGDIHLTGEFIKYDENRTGEIKKYDINVIRFRNKEIIEDIDNVMREIKTIINTLSDSSSFKEAELKPLYPGRGVWGEAHSKI
jgi:very-short-patch-repair endonuclease